jgi:hypothetical protein
VRIRVRRKRRPQSLDLAGSHFVVLLREI